MRNLFSITEPNNTRQDEQAEAVDHDWRPPPASASHQEHGLPEVLQHGAVALHALCALRSSNHRSGRAGACARKVSYKGRVSDVTSELHDMWGTVAG